jgi:hypothetical protein
MENWIFLTSSLLYSTTNEMLGCSRHSLLMLLVLLLLLQCLGCLTSELKRSFLILYIIPLICFASCLDDVRTYLGILQHWFVDVVVCVITTNCIMVFFHPLLRKHYIENKQNLTVDRSDYTFCILTVDSVRIISISTLFELKLKLK